LKKPRLTLEPGRKSLREKPIQLRQTEIQKFLTYSKVSTQRITYILWELEQAWVRNQLLAEHSFGFHTCTVEPGGRRTLDRTTLGGSWEC
jgi:hypothetical protein